MTGTSRVIKRGAGEAPAGGTGGVPQLFKVPQRLGDLGGSDQHLAGHNSL